jgi:hypothetical protein
MLPLGVVLLVPSKAFERLPLLRSVYFGMIIASGEPPPRRGRGAFRAQLRHYSVFDQKMAPIRPALFARRGSLDRRLSRMPAKG